MPKIQYRKLNIKSYGMLIIGHVNSIVEEYARMGYTLTLRQVYYQLVARDIVPNNLKSYTSVGDFVANGRLTGLIDWNAIEDRTRYLRSLSHWGGPDQIVGAAAQGYRRDLWENQPNYVEVWVEKDALIGVVEQAATKYDVPCFSCRGYTSQSEMWRAAMRMMSAGRPVTVLHLGDHDPSGIDMTRDIEDRLREFGQGDLDLTIKRIALNYDQIETYSPPPNPAKLTDSRAKAYINMYGTASWELDALKPTVIDGLISEHLEDLIDQELMDETRKEVEQERKVLTEAVDFVRNREEHKTPEELENEYIKHDRLRRVGEIKDKKAKLEEELPNNEVLYVLED